LSDPSLRRPRPSQSFCTLESVGPFPICPYSSATVPRVPSSLYDHPSSPHARTFAYFRFRAPPSSAPFDLVSQLPSYDHPLSPHARTFVYFRFRAPPSSTPFASSPNESNSPQLSHLSAAGSAPVSNSASSRSRTRARSPLPTAASSTKSRRSVAHTIRDGARHAARAESDDDDDIHDDDDALTMHTSVTDPITGEVSRVTHAAWTGGRERESAVPVD
jgi:hypothetical protein